MCRYGRRQPEGTFLNGSRVSSRTRLNHGDRLKVGTVPATFWLIRSSQPPTEHAIGNSTALVTAVRHVTVLVADIRDFTGLARHLGDERLSNVIGPYMRLLDRNWTEPAQRHRNTSATQ
jgi:adenylate cyclase